MFVWKTLKKPMGADASYPIRQLCKGDGTPVLSLFEDNSRYKYCTSVNTSYFKDLALKPFIISFNELGKYEVSPSNDSESKTFGTIALQRLERLCQNIQNDFAQQINGLVDEIAPLYEELAGPKTATEKMSSPLQWIDVSKTTAFGDPLLIRQLYMKGTSILKLFEDKANLKYHTCIDSDTFKYLTLTPYSITCADLLERYPAPPLNEGEIGTLETLTCKRLDSLCYQDIWKDFVAQIKGQSETLAPLVQELSATITSFNKSTQVSPSED